MKFRYRVLDFKGEVPEQVANIAGKDDAYLLYSEWRGVESLQEYWEDGEGVIGCWFMQYAGLKTFGVAQ